MTIEERSEYVYKLMDQYEHGPQAVATVADEIKDKGTQTDLLWIGAGLGKMVVHGEEMLIMITHLITVISRVLDGKEVPGFVVPPKRVLH